MANFSPLQSEHVDATFDEETAIVYIRYHGELDASASQAAYGWLEGLLKQVGSQSIYGEIFDFTKVTGFLTENIVDARKNSRKMNLMMDTHHFPVAMIVSGDMHVEILRGPMGIPEGNLRKRIVESETAARAFLDEWHEKEDNA